MEDEINVKIRGGRVKEIDGKEVNLPLDALQKTIEVIYDYKQVFQPEAKHENDNTWTDKKYEQLKEWLQEKGGFTQTQKQFFNKVIQAEGNWISIDNIPNFGSSLARLNYSCKKHDLPYLYEDRWNETQMEYRITDEKLRGILSDFL